MHSTTESNAINRIFFIFIEVSESSSRPSSSLESELLSSIYIKFYSLNFLLTFWGLVTAVYLTDT